MHWDNSIYGAITVAGVVYWLFRRLDGLLNKATKDAIASWLLRLEVGPNAQRFPVLFSRLFDRVFTEHHVSLRCFWRSLILSYSFVFLVALVDLGVHWDYYYLKYSRPMFSDHQDLVALVRTVLFWPMVVSIVPDYLSLLETRYILRLMKGVARPILVFALLAVDLLASALIFLLWFGGVFMALDVGSVVGMAEWLLWDLSTLFTASTGDVLFPVDLLGWTHHISQRVLQLLFCSTFLTSIWLWLYAIAGFSVKALFKLDAVRRLITKYFDVEGKPVEVVGALVAMMVFGLWLLVVD